MSKKMKEKHKSKKNMLQHLKKIMSDDMGCGIEDMLAEKAKKSKIQATIAANSPEDLKKGAKKLISMADRIKADREKLS